MKMFLARPDFEHNRSSVLITFEQALDIIKVIDNLTLGIKKIVYLVGWQGLGHDDCFPEMETVNEFLKRECDETAKESLYWLFEEAKKYNTVVSFHGNVADVYGTNASFPDFVKANAVVNGLDGKPAVIEIFNGRDAYKSSYKQYWDSGLFKKYWDRFCEATPVREAGTVHLDNFCIAQNLNPFTSVEEEDEGRNKMLDYIASLGIDVTTEYTYRELELRAESPDHPIRKIYETACSPLPVGSFEDAPIRTLGRIPASWWTSGMTVEDCMRIKPSLYSGHLTDPALLSAFYGAMHGEDIWMDKSIDPSDWIDEFVFQFCTLQLPYFYLNRFERLRYEPDGDDYTVFFSDDVISRGREHSITKGGITLKKGGDVILPLNDENTVFVVYSKDGRSGSWAVPDAAGTVAEVFKISGDGKIQYGNVEASEGVVSLDVGEGEALALYFKAE